MKNAPPAATGKAFADPQVCTLGESFTVSIPTPRVEVLPTRSLLGDAVALVTEHLGARPVQLHSDGATAGQRAGLLAHLGRETLHGAPKRNFSAAWRKNSDGTKTPRLYRIDSSALGRLQYVKLAHPQRATVIVLDIDQTGTEGGQVSNLHPNVMTLLAQLADHDAGPAWIGINPLNGKGQLIWQIDPVYADTSGDSSNIRLLKATTAVLCDLLGADQHFAHGFSRSPFYTGDDPTAYRWHYQHARVHRLSTLIEEARAMSGAPAGHTPAPRQSFTSGRELIEAVKARREEATAYWKIAKELEGEIADMDAYDAERIDGVKVLWLIEGQRAARDETAFRHALRSAYKLRAAGNRMTDAAIIDAYEHAYTVAQQVGADGRVAEMPPMRDRQTMARRVRGYVLAGNKDGGSKTSGGAGSGTATSRERKALATMGSRGGKKAAQRWKDRDSEYAKNELAKLEKTHRKKRIAGQTTKARIQTLVGQHYIETGKVLSRKEIMTETGLSRATVTRYLSVLRSEGLIPET